jgi:hypothetical protein
MMLANMQPMNETRSGRTKTKRFAGISRSTKSAVDPMTKLIYDTPGRYVKLVERHHDALIGLS